MHTFSIQIESAGNIREHDDKRAGWQLTDHGAADPNALGKFDQRGLVVVQGSGVYISVDLMDALGVGGRYGIALAGCGIKLATGRRIWAVTQDLLDEIEQHVSYERRSEREWQVQERNAGIWNFITSLYMARKPGAKDIKVAITWIRRSKRAHTVYFLDGATERFQRDESGLEERLARSPILLIE